MHMSQLMPLPLTVSCFSKIQIGFTFLVPAHPGSPGKGPLNGCVCARIGSCMRGQKYLEPCFFRPRTKRTVKKCSRVDTPTRAAPRSHPRTNLNPKPNLDLDLDLLTSKSVDAEVLPWLSLPTLVLAARRCFFFTFRARTDRQSHRGS